MSRFSPIVPHNESIEEQKDSLDGSLLCAADNLTEKLVAGDAVSAATETQFM